MSNTTHDSPGNVITTDNERITRLPDRVVRGSVEETSSASPAGEAYDAQATRAGYHGRRLQTKNVTVERVSLSDSTLLASYAENIQRYQFASRFSRGKRALDAGCGSGYGAHFLAANGASSVLGVDISPEAITEAKTHYRRENLRYECQDLEALKLEHTPATQFGVVVNFENLAHLSRPERMMQGVSELLPEGGIFIVSTPNGAVIPKDESGRPLYKFQHRAYLADELSEFLAAYFPRITMYGQWLTHAGMLHKMRSKELFDQLCEAYYNPMSRLGRVLKRAMGRRVEAPPRLTAASDSFVGDYEIHPLDAEVYPWAPTVLLAIAEK